MSTQEVAGAAASLLKDLQGAAQMVAKQAREFQFTYGPIFEQIPPFLTSREQLLKIAEPLLETQRRLQEFAKSKASELTALHHQVFEFQNRIKELLSTDYSAIIEAFKLLPKRTQEALLLLGKHGWYLDPDMAMPGLWSLAEALAEGNISEAEDTLVGYYEQRLGEIEDSVSAKFPLRAPLIRMALAAHRRGEYALAIPVLLAQADGICKEQFNNYLFIRKDKRPQTAAFVEEVAADTYIAALLSPLATALPITASEKERGVSFNGLNRHTVMHGESLDYGTKANSLRALSLLHYVTHVFPEKPDAPRIPMAETPPLNGPAEAE